MLSGETSNASVILSGVAALTFVRPALGTHAATRSKNLSVAEFSGTYIYRVPFSGYWRLREPSAF